MLTLHIELIVIHVEEAIVQILNQYLKLLCDDLAEGIQANAEQQRHLLGMC